MATVCVIGAGDLGGAAACALALDDRVERVVLIDDARGVAEGKALDIRQSGAVAGFRAVLEGTDDRSRAIGSAVCVVADRAGPPAAEWQGEAGLALVARLAASVDAPLVFAGARQAELLAAAAFEAHVPRERLIGSAPEALASAIRAVVAMEARCSPSEVDLTVLGSPEGGFVVPWSGASVGGSPLADVLDAVQVVRLEARAARLWPPGPFTLGCAAAHVARSAVTGGRRACSVLAVLDGEFGVRRRVGAVPALLAPWGIAEYRVPSLSPRERVRLETVLAAGG
jgi:malate dehydrogenase